MIGDNKNLKDQDGNILKLKEENSSLVKKIAGNKYFFNIKYPPNVPYSDVNMCVWT